MTQEQLDQVEAWRESLDVKQNDEHIVNAMWLAEEMWERHHAILQAADEITKFKGLFKSHELGIDFNTYMSYFCMTLMEYIWMPHTIIMRITKDLNDWLPGASHIPENFTCRKLSSGAIDVRAHYIVTNDSGHDNEMPYNLVIMSDIVHAEALTAILNHANKAGHDAVTRLSA